jgi:hypothetical protein
MVLLAVVLKKREKQQKEDDKMEKEKRILAATATTTSRCLEAFLQLSENVIERCVSANHKIKYYKLKNHVENERVWMG